MSSKVSTEVSAAEIRWNRERIRTIEKNCSEAKETIFIDKEINLGSLLMLGKIDRAQVFVRWIRLEYGEAYI